MSNIVVALDGHAGSGKGTIARGLSERLGFFYLDTGLFYRAVAYFLLEESIPPVLSRAPDIILEKDIATLIKTIEPVRLRNENVGNFASQIATDPLVRERLVTLQRSLASNPPGGELGAVLDGRDVGTVVCPDAVCKIFVTASLEVRAYRRFLELQKTEFVSYRNVLKDLEQRDYRDQNREFAPLLYDDRYHFLDTTELTIPAAIEKTLKIVDKCLSK